MLELFEVLFEALILLVNILNTAICAYAPLLASFPDPARLLLGAYLQYCK